MCGINGFNFRDEKLIKVMNNRIRHRGPDDEGFYLDENVSLGHRRLSIIDLSEKGRQPLFNENKSICLIFNGEIYNFRELRRELEKRGHKLYSKTDSEVILHLYEDYGKDCLKSLNGIFAFAIWDTRKKELFLARDRIGVKPLYYYYKDNKFIFSSEIKAILEHPIKKEINLEAFNHYFRLLYVPAPLTMLKDVYKLPQAHYLMLKTGSAKGGPNFQKLEIRKYWDIDDFKDMKSKEEIIERIRELTKESVEGQLISDRPVGIFLSGGIDSTSVLGITSRLLSDKIKTFTVGFEIYDPNKKFVQDILLARQTSQYYQTEHHELFVNSKDILDNIATVFYHMDEPVAEPTQVATFLLSKLAKKEVAVVLGGDGGDELFGGYKRYYYSYILSKYWITKFFPFLKSKLHTKFMFQKEEEISKILNEEINQTRITSKFFKEKYLRQYSVPDFEKLFMLIDLKTWLADESLMRTDKTTMAFGLEQRVPFLDHRLAELAMKIPSKYKMRDKNQGKEIFIEAMKDYLPEHILNSDKKKVWMTPMSEWLRTDLKNFASEILSPNYSSQTKNYFDFKGIERVFIDHVEKRQYNLNLIWALITFQFWYKQFIEKK